MNTPAAFRVLPRSRPVQPPTAGLIHLCAWCEPRRKAAREAAAHALGLAVSHGICPTCRDRMLADVRTVALAEAGA